MKTSNLAAQTKQTPFPRAPQRPTPSRPMTAAKIVRETLTPKKTAAKSTHAA